MMEEINYLLLNLDPLISFVPCFAFQHAYRGFSLSVNSSLEVYQDNYIKLASTEMLEVKYWQKEMERVDAKEELQIMLDQLNTNQQENQRLFRQIGPNDPIYINIIRRVKLNEAFAGLTT